MVFLMLRGFFISGIFEYVCVVIYFSDDIAILFHKPEVYLYCIKTQHIKSMISQLNKTIKSGQLSRLLSVIPESYTVIGILHPPSCQQ